MKQLIGFLYCFRYTPDQYPSEIEWSARLMLERSLAIKCPSIHYHLAGTKKVQQRLAEKGMLEYFFPGPENAAKVEKIRSIFTGLYELSKEVSKPPICTMCKMAHFARNAVISKDLKVVLKRANLGDAGNYG